MNFEDLTKEEQYLECCFCKQQIKIENDAYVIGKIDYLFVNSFNQHVFTTNEGKGNAKIYHPNCFQIIAGKEYL